jgi:hypothetical protein
MIMMHFTDSLIDVDGASSVAQAQSGALTVANSLFFDNANGEVFPAETGDADNDGGFDEDAFFHASELSNLFVDPKLEDATNLASPNFAPASGSPVMSGGATPSAGFDTSATFIGAIGAEDWTAGWTAYP